MNVELLSVGTELLLGEILNTNAKYLAEELSIMGLDVYYQTTVGDNPNRLKEAVEIAFSRADMLIATGGLGPTQDDITKEVIAESLGFELEFDSKAYDEMKEFFKKNRRVMPESNRKQAMMPVGGITLYNTCGTAPGCIMKKNGKAAIILPGPPSEMKAMFETAKQYIENDEKIYTKNLRIFGIGESQTAEILDDFISKGGAVTVAPYALTGEVRLRIAVKTSSESEAEKILAETAEKIKLRLGDVVYSEEDKGLAETVLELLRENNLKISAAESCTGGSFAKMITDIPGSSEILGESYVTYSPEAKIKLLGVSEESIKKHTVVSEEVAEQMARGVKRASKSDIGVAFTGYAGPGGENVGLVYMGVAYGERCEVRELHINGNRSRVRHIACLNGFDSVRRMILNIL